MTEKIKVGQKLFVVTRRSYVQGPQTRERIVVKVGRKWAYFEDILDRFDIEKLRFESDYPSRAIFFSEEEYVLQTTRDQLWSRIRSSVSAGYSVPPNLTLEQLETFAKALSA